MIEIINEREMTTGLDREIREALCVCFPADADHFRQTRQWHGSGPAFSVISRERGRVEAHVGVVERSLTAGDVWLRAAGVQNVFVLPDCRGRGLVDEVMAASMEEAGRRGFDCGLLFCVPELEKVYARCGWQTAPDVPVVRVEEGRELPLPGKNIAMFYSLGRREFPAGTIHLRGNDW